MRPGADSQEGDKEKDKDNSQSLFCQWKLALFEKRLIDKSLLAAYNSERLPVISGMLEMATSMLNQTITTGDFNSIVLDGFASPGKPINAYGMIDEGHLEAGDRTPDAPNMLRVGGGESVVKTILVYTDRGITPCLYSRRCNPDRGRTGGMRQKCCAHNCRSAVIGAKGYAYSAYVLEINKTKVYKTKVFVIQLDKVIGANVRGAEGVNKYLSMIFLGV
ncbi:hypothetical protein DEU56DRAFT_918803 [Suillus clintonianus]|uniref:uncharacterized protein n=1 Tax=Suillus clintonianus TaxID=1904413 RepID=UPI001B862949|nr:uncharacterized protein DEU56DRAFT_918803 [Suillus clintonianus]KAG2118487.1 hypothetical protein DEU56DRAFT_918803 [Suillus clintonianus]